jgi:hypothetical protein
MEPDLFLLDLLFAFVIGSTVAWGWSSIFRTHGPWNSFLWFLVVILLSAWGGGLWIEPFGPTSFGVAWMPFLLTGIFMALLLTAVTPQAVRRRHREGGRHGMGAARRGNADEVETLETFDRFFWMLVLVLAVCVLGRYAWRLNAAGAGFP